MNNEFNLNTRTLIVSFAFLLMVMVPLRFVEVGNSIDQSPPMVLGDSIEMSTPRLEAPYDYVDSTDDCLTGSYVDKVVGVLNKEKKAGYKKQVEVFLSRICR